jgi:uncharacterized protein (DUF2249 family)
MSTETIGASERVIDVRDIEPRFRHQIIHQLVEHLAPDSSLQLIADRRPQPLRYQLALRFGAQCVWSYLEEGPDSGVSGSPRRPIRHRKTSKAARCLRAAPEIGLMMSGSATVRSSVKVGETLAVVEHDLAGAREHQNALIVEL